MESRTRFTRPTRRVKDMCACSRDVIFPCRFCTRVECLPSFYASYQSVMIRPLPKYQPCVFKILLASTPLKVFNFVVFRVPVNMVYHWKVVWIRDKYRCNKAVHEVDGCVPVF